MRPEIDRLSFNISTGSLYPANPKKLWEAAITPFTTRAIAENAIAFKEAVFGVTPDVLKDLVRVGISLHWSDRIHASQLVRLLDSHEIPITSHDIPDIESLGQLGNKITKTLFSRTSLTEKINASILDGGWYLVNVASEKNRIHRLHDAMFATRNSTVSPVIIRTSVSEFMRNRDTSPLFRILQSYAISKNIALALEIDAKDYTPSQYMSIMRQLNNETYHGIPIFADMDLGHIAESAAHHPQNEIPEVNDFLHSVLSGSDARLVATVSLNQYAGGAHTHVWLDNPDGQVDIPKTGSALADARARLPFGPVVIIETYPQYTPQLIAHPRILGDFLQKFT